MYLEVHPDGRVYGPPLSRNPFDERPSPKQLARNRRLVDDLAAHGYFDWLPAEHRESALEECREHGWPFMEEVSGRGFWADAENVMEGDVERLLEEMEPSLIRCGVEPLEVKSREVPGEYVVEVQGVRHLIVRRDESRDWSIASKRFFVLVNGLLNDAGSEERLFAVSGGNDQEAFLLSPEHYAILVDFLGEQDQDLPFRLDLRDSDPSG